MEEVRTGNEPQPSKEWLELQEKFVNLCTISIYLSYYVINVRIY